MYSLFPDSQADRLNSLKAAGLAGFTAIVMAAVLWLVHPTAPGWPVCLAIAAVSGSLFGITYRYAVRQDPNPQIKAGVVFAFGLVRGLALGQQAGFLWPALLWLTMVACGESLVLFGGAAIALEGVHQRGWLPFPGDASPLPEQPGEHR